MKSFLPVKYRTGRLNERKPDQFDDRCEITAEQTRERLRNYRPTPDDAVKDFGLYQRGGRS